MIVRGNGAYDAGGGQDALFADWSGATDDIVWHNQASSTVQAVNGSTISNVERLLVSNRRRQRRHPQHRRIDGR